MSGRLSGKVCVITGSAGRIGRGCVERFLAAGATVIGVDIIKADIERIDNVKCDVGSVEEIEGLNQYLKEKYGRIDVLVNNGGLGGQRCPFHEKALQEYQEVMDVNVRAPILLSQLAIRLHLALAPSQPEKQLSIINMASIAGHRSASHASIYGVSKHALIGLTKNVAVEYAEQGVRCNSISPGIMEVPNIQGYSKAQVDTMHSRVPLQRGGKPTEVGDLAVFLASDESSYITGEDILIDGGMRVGSI